VQPPYKQNIDNRPERNIIEQLVAVGIHIISDRSLIIVQSGRCRRSSQSMQGLIFLFEFRNTMLKLAQLSSKHLQWMLWS